MDTLKEQAIEQWRELRACTASLRLPAQNPMVRVIRPVSAVRVMVRHVAIRLHAARSAIEDSAARFFVRIASRASFGIAVRGFSLLGEPFKLFETQVHA